jgi:uncharacterized protein YegJ (DUF2314 family)
MDAYSWFRQKRQGIRPVVEAEVHIPVTAAPTVGYVVYFRADADEPRPTEDELSRIALRWIGDHTEDPLRSTLEAFLQQGLLSLLVHDRDSIPEPPDELLRAYNPGETEERRFRNATHAILVGSPDLLVPPRIGLWAVLAASRALAAFLPGGALVDPLFPRLLPLEGVNADLPPDGHVRLVDHILIPYSLDADTGLAWITTKGMDRFGLPELEIRDVPPNLVNGLMPVMNGLAQRLANAAMEMVMENGDDEEPPDYFSHRAQFWFGLGDVRRAYATHSDEPDGADERLDNEGTSLVRLEVTRGRGSEEVFVRLVPPHGVRYDPGVWLNSLLTDLFGSDPQIAAVETGDAAMENAHNEAVAELPLVRARFRAGFRSGEVLHVKHGFPTDGTGHEYMWIVVTGWEEDGRIHGHLANDPQYRRDLRAGQAVEIGEDEVYDWLIVHTDGRTEGAFTNRALGSEE